MATVSLVRGATGAWLVNVMVTGRADVFMTAILALDPEGGLTTRNE